MKNQPKNYNNPLCKKNKNNFENQPKMKIGIDERSYNDFSNDSDDYIGSEDEIISLEKKISENKNKINDIIIKKTNSKDKEEVPLEEVKLKFDKKEYEELQKYEFPYMRQSKFNNEIYQVSIKEFRMLYFYCPVCSQKYRQYSIPYHIFQYHFPLVEKYLNQKEIANCAAKLMQNEYKKIDKSLKFYGELAVLFSGCNYRGNNETIFEADNSLNILKNLDFESKYLNISVEQAKEYLTKILPINKNKNKIRNYKPRKRKKEE